MNLSYRVLLIGAISFVSVFPLLSGEENRLTFKEDVVKNYPNGSAAIVGSGTTACILPDNPTVDFEYHIPIDAKTKGPTKDAENIILYAPYVGEGRGSIYSRKFLSDLTVMSGFSVFTFNIAKHREDAHYSSFDSGFFPTVFSIRNKICEKFKFGNPKPISLIGESRGASMIFELAAHFPKEVRSIASIGATRICEEPSNEMVPRCVVYTYGDSTLPLAVRRSEEWRTIGRPSVFCLAPCIPELRGTYNYVHSPHDLALGVASDYTAEMIKRERGGLAPVAYGDFDMKPLLALASLDRWNFSVDGNPDGGILSPIKTPLIPSSAVRLPILKRDRQMGNMRLIDAGVRDDKDIGGIYINSSPTPLTAVQRTARRDDFNDFIAKGGNVTGVFIEGAVDLNALKYELKALDFNSCLLLGDDIEEVGKIYDVVRMIAQRGVPVVISTRGAARDKSLFPRLAVSDLVIHREIGESLPLSGRIFVSRDGEKYSDMLSQASTGKVTDNSKRIAQNIATELDNSAYATRGRESLVFVPYQAYEIQRKATMNVVALFFEKKMDPIDLFLRLKNAGYVEE